MLGSRFIRLIRKLGTVGVNFKLKILHLFPGIGLEAILFRKPTHLNLLKHQKNFSYGGVLVNPRWLPNYIEIGNKHVIFGKKDVIC